MASFIFFDIFYSAGHRIRELLKRVLSHIFPGEVKSLSYLSSVFGAGSLSVRYLINYVPDVLHMV